MKKLMLMLLLCLVAVMPANAAAKANHAAVGSMPGSRIEREVRHELLMLPYYTIFDSLAFRVDGSTVTLMGEVTRPVLKDDAERAVKKVEGVESVKNEIRVLPLSSFDDRIRIAAFRAIYDAPALNRYAHQAMPPIHIIVDNGRITLEGVVANEFDRNLAYMKALGVHGAFSVTNHLKIEQQS
jgi:hyperosmotically inducible protein